MEAAPLFLVICAAIAMAVITVSYYLVPPQIIERKSEYVKFALVFLTAYLILFSIMYIILFNRITLDKAFMLLSLWFFPLLFLAQWLYKFKTVKKNQHIGFLLFWAALCSLPLGLGVLYGLIF